MKNDNQYQVQELTISRAVGFTVAETKQGYNVDKSNAFTQYPNSIFDTLSSKGLPIHAHMSLAEGAIFNRCVRETNGWHRNSFRMSLSEMAKLTGLSKQGVINSVNSLAQSGLISYNPNNGVGIWTIALGNLESALEYYASQSRSTQLTVNKKKSRSTQFTEPSTEFTDKSQIGKLSLPPSSKEKNQINSKENTTTNASKSDAPFLESEADSEFLAELKRLQATNSTIDGKDDSANTVTLGAVVVPPPSAAQNPPPSIDPRVVAYCNALGWVIDGKGVMTTASADVKKMCAFYGDTLTGDDMSAVLAHLKALGTEMDARTIKAKFGKAVQDVGIMTNSRNKALVEAIKVMYGQTKGIEYRLEFEYSKLASRMAQQGVTPEMIIAFPAVWESNHNGYNLPGYDNLKLITNIKNMTMKGNGNQATKSAEQTKIEAEAWLAEVTQGVR